MATNVAACTSMVRAYIDAPYQIVALFLQPHIERKARVEYACEVVFKNAIPGVVLTSLFMFVMLKLLSLAALAHQTAPLWLFQLSSLIPIMALAYLLAHFGGQGYHRCADRQQLKDRVREAY